MRRDTDKVAQLKPPYPSHVSIRLVSRFQKQTPKIECLISFDYAAIYVRFYLIEFDFNQLQRSIFGIEAALLLKSRH